MSYLDELLEAKKPRKKAEDRLNEYIESLPADEADALRELIVNYPTRIAYEALRRHDYKLTRETLTAWKAKYVV